MCARYVPHWSRIRRDLVSQRTCLHVRTHAGQTLDEVDGAAEIAWVQPRILDRSQIGSLATRLHSWSDSVSNLVTSMRAEAPELFAA